MNNAPLEQDLGTTIIALEAGGSWPGWFSSSRGAAPGAVIEVQDASEDARAFAERVVRRIQALDPKQGEVPLRLGAIVAGTDGSDAVLEARLRMARAMVGAMSRESELVFAAERAPSTSGRVHDLFALAGELGEELASRRVCVRVRLRDPDEQSSIVPVLKSGVVFDRPLRQAIAK